MGEKILLHKCPWKSSEPLTIIIQFCNHSTKRGYRQFFYFETTLANGIKSFLNIILHENGNYYLYTISKNITVYE